VKGYRIVGLGRHRLQQAHRYRRRDQKAQQAAIESGISRLGDVAVQVGSHGFRKQPYRQEAADHAQPLRQSREMIIAGEDLKVGCDKLGPRGHVELSEIGGREVGE